MLTAENILSNVVNKVHYTDVMRCLKQQWLFQGKFLFRDNEMVTEGEVCAMQ